ncbi:tRNA A37 methylthiotransferase MiaB [Bradyrhizobium sp. i1.3.6]
MIEYSTVTGTVAMAVTLDQAVTLERLENLAQHLLRNAFNRSAQLIEAHRLLAQQQQDQHRPFVADAVEDLARGAVRCIDVWLHRQLLTIRLAPCRLARR